MTLVRIQTRNGLALILAYVLAIQGIGNSFGWPHQSAERVDVTTLCRALPVGEGVPAADHDGDRCQIICTSGACGQVLPLGGTVKSAGLEPAIDADMPGEAQHVVGVVIRDFARFARGPPLSFL